MGASVAAFDLDMTLIDSRTTILAAFDAAAGELQVAIDLDAVDARLGLKLEDELRHWIAEGDLDDAVACYRRHYLDRAKTTTLLPGATEALDAVRTAGYESAVVTAKHPASALVCISAAGLSFNHTYCSVHGRGKASILSELSAVFYVGDTPDDMTAARHANVVAIGVATGSFSQDALAAAGADIVLDNLSAFHQWFTANHP